MESEPAGETVAAKNGKKKTDMVQWYEQIER
jgi:hypothetical protein